jgi:hypothetical protein
MIEKISATGQKAIAWFLLLVFYTDMVAMAHTSLNRGNIPAVSFNNYGHKKMKGVTGDREPVVKFDAGSSAGLNYRDKKVKPAALCLTK